MRRPGRTTRVPLLVPAVLLQVAAWFAVLAHGTDWVGAWMNAVDQVAGSVVITGPMLAGLTASTVARLDRTALPDLVVSSVHPVRGWYEPALRLWLVAAGNLVVVLAGAAVLVGAAGPRLFARPLLILPICWLVLAIHALVGMVIGLNLSPRLAGPVAGTVSFGLFLLSVAQLAPAAFDPAGVGGVLVGQQYRSEVLVALAVIAALTAIAVATATGWTTGFRRSRFVIAVVAVAGAVALSSGRLVDLDDRYEAVEAPLTCRGSEPQVCVPVDADRTLVAAATKMHRFAAPLRAAGVRLPQRWVYSWGQRQPRDDGMLRLFDRSILGSNVADDSVVESLTSPAWCGGAATQRALDVRLLLGYWIRVRNGLAVASTQLPKAWFTSAESEAWVRATYEKLGRCASASLSFPTRPR